MSDTRVTMLGIAAIFAGFLVLGIFGDGFSPATIEAEEFEQCYEYPEDGPPIMVDCEQKLMGKYVFFGVVIALIAGGIMLLIRGIRGDWDQRVRPEDMVGPGRPDSRQTQDSD